MDIQAIHNPDMPSRVTASPDTAVTANPNTATRLAAVKQGRRSLVCSPLDMPPRIHSQPEPLRAVEGNQALDKRTPDKPVRTGSHRHSLGFQTSLGLSW